MRVISFILDSITSLNLETLEPLGLPEFYSASLLTCHGLMTPVDLHILAKADASMLPSAPVKILGVLDCFFEAVPAIQRARSPLRPARFSAYVWPILFDAPSHCLFSGVRPPRMAPVDPGSRLVSSRVISTSCTYNSQKASPPWPPGTIRGGG